MDSDDILETDALRQCYQICEQDKLDIICFDAETFAEDSDYTGFYHYCRQNIINETKIWTGIELLNYELEHNVFFVPPWLFFTNHRFLQNTSVVFLPESFMRIRFSPCKYCYMQAIYVTFHKLSSNAESETNQQ